MTMISPDRGHAGADAHGHDHASSKAPWLILVPVLVLLLVAPPALGADAVARNASSQGLAGYDVPWPQRDPAGQQGRRRRGHRRLQVQRRQRLGERLAAVAPDDALPGAGRAPIRRWAIKDLVLRALYDADNSVQDVPVTVTGFIAPAGRRLHRRLHDRPDGDQLLRRRRQPDAAARRR